MKKCIIILFCFTVFFVSKTTAQQVEATTGKITFIRINDVGGQFGPPSDRIDVEVVIKISSKPDNTFGFKLRKDDNQITHEAMLNLLKEAFDNDKNIKIEYNAINGKKNYVLFRVIMEK
jgi:hypothetical protein